MDRKRIDASYYLLYRCCGQRYPEQLNTMLKAELRARELRKEHPNCEMIIYECVKVFKSTPGHHEGNYG
jgi:hypothetical protein